MMLVELHNASVQARLEVSARRMRKFDNTWYVIRARKNLISHLPAGDGERSFSPASGALVSEDRKGPFVSRVMPAKNGSFSMEL